MLDSVLKLAVDPGAEEHLRRQMGLHEAAVLASAGRGAVADVADAEQAVSADPAGAFTFDQDGRATLTTGRRTWDAGRFEVVSIGELRRRASAPRDVRQSLPRDVRQSLPRDVRQSLPRDVRQSLPRDVRQSLPRAPGKRARLFILEGVSPVTDIGSLQATTDDALFQVASQFNCLESPGPFVAPVVDYFTDNTQGPRAAISAFPGTLLRHYAAPGAGGERFVQATDARQIDLLAAVSGPGLARVQNGYLKGGHVTDPKAFAEALESRFEAIQVGVHADVQVALGYDRDGGVEDSDRRRIAQVFTSTVAGGGSPALVPVCRQLLRAAYLGTLLATATLGRKRAVLTLIGGGVFGNPVALIWESILWALDEMEPLLVDDLDVIVNSRNPVPRDPTFESIRGRCAAWLVFSRDGGLQIRR